MKTSCPSPYKADTVAAVLATGLAGLVAGSLAFASFVDVRTLLQMVGSDNDNDTTDKDVEQKKKKKNIETVAHFFPAFWPNGRDWMVPLLGAASLAHFATYYLLPKSNTGCCGSNSAGHDKMSWLYAGLAIFGIAPYTKLYMGSDIATLCDNTDKRLTDEQVAEATRMFCQKHHVRTVVAMAAFSLSLVSIIHLPRSSGGPVKKQV
jgi:hypothetical protein